MKGTRGLVLAGAGLTLGFIIGFSVIAVRQTAKQELVAMLDEIVRESCDCTLKYDSFDVSLLTLSARARRIRMESDGKVALVFDRLRASFSLRDIFHRRVWLDELKLIDGFADGVLPGSPTFKFIENLATPIPPERDRPDRWRLKLARLTARTTRISQPIGDTRMELVGFRLDMNRNEENDFVLSPVVDRIDVLGQGNRVRIGNLSANIVLDDNKVVFNSTQIARGESWISTKGASLTDQGNALTGGMSFRLFPTSFGLNPFVAGALSGEGQWGGTLESPRLLGTAATLKELPLSFTLSPFAPLKFDQASLGFTARVLESGEISLALNPIAALGEGLSLQSRIPLSLHHGKFSGSLGVLAHKVDGDGFALAGVESEIVLGGNVRNPTLAVSGTIAQALLGGSELHDLKIQAQLNNRGMTASLTTPPDDRASLVAHASATWEPEPRLDSLEFRGALGLGTAPSSPILRLDGAAQGPLTKSGLKGSGGWSVTSAANDTVLKGALSLKEGVLSIVQSPGSQNISVRGSIPLLPDSRGTLNVSLSEFSPALLSENLRCVSATGDLTYSFSPQKPFLGDGSLSLGALRIGCAPYVLTLAQPISMKINGGNSDLRGFVLRGEDSKVAASGKLGFENSDVNLTGDAQLASFLGILPSVDGASGRVTGDVSIRGPILFPEIRGTGSIENGAFWIEAAGVAIEKLHAQISLSDREIAISGIEGILNSGELRGDAYFFPLSPERSHASLRTREIVLTPYENTSLTFSTNLSLLPGDRSPLLEGTITIDEAHFQQQIDLKSLIKVVTGLFFPRQRGAIATSTLPPLDLDLSIVAPRNIFVATNLFSGEFSSDLRLTGEINNPSITGQLSSLAGWFKFKDTRFDISSGRLFLQPGGSDPLLEFIAETYVHSPQGENVLVFLEGRGPLSDPQISLASEEGLSELEILTMLTLGSSFGGQTLANAGSRIEWLEPDTLLDFRRPRTFSSFFKDLTRIDSLNVEPSYNVRSGAIEPTLVARKKLSERASLQGENWFGSSAQASRFGLLYDLTPKVNVAGGITTRTSNDQTALTLDLTYTILARQSPFIELSVRGNRYASPGNILEALRMSSASRIPRSEVDRLRRDLLRWYGQEGYFNSSVELASHDDGKFVRRLEFNIKEGPPSSIEAIQIDGDDLLPDNVRAKLPSRAPHNEARSFVADLLRDQITRLLRNEGYVAAHVATEYRDGTSPESKILHIRILPGRPISFVFLGATVFTPGDFLETINLFERRQPFGINTAGILAANIERLYRERGYLSMTQSLSYSDDPGTGRRTYQIEISEGQRIFVRDVRFSGFPLSPKELTGAINEAFPTRHDAIFEPEFAVREELDINREVLRGAIIAKGYPDIDISYELSLDEESHSVTIEYNAVPGAPFLVRSLTVERKETHYSLPEAPPVPCAIGDVNSYIERLTTRAKEEGYYSAELHTTFSTTPEDITIEITEGKRSTIGSIAIEGNNAIDESVIRDLLQFHEGDPLRQAPLDESRRALLRAGLFSRVAIEPTLSSGSDEAVPLRISVEERPLQTLEVGTGLNSEDGIHLFGEATDRGLFRDGRTLSFRSDLYYDPAQTAVSQGVASFRFSLPTVFSSSYRLIEDLRFQRSELDTQEFNLDRVTLSSSLYREWEKGWSVSFGHTLLDESLNEVAPGAIIGEFDSGDVRLSFINGTVALDRRNNPLNPTDGYSAAFDYRIASRAVGSQASYGGVGGRLSLVTPISRTYLPRIRFASQIRGASSWTFDDTDEVPITQRYYAGGRTSVRGFRENSLGPRGLDGAVIGGDILFVGNAELRYLFPNSFSLVGFFDAGSVFLHDEGISLRDLRESAGLGLRYVSPIGPLGVDIGFPLDERSGEPSARMHFTIGSQF